MDNGYIKLFRSLMGKGYYLDSQYVHLWVHLLMKASFQEKEFLFNDKLHHLNPGQFITGRKALSQETGIEESKCERMLKCFESEQQIEQQKTNKFRIISIVNWNKYQLCEQQNEQPVNNQRTTNEQPVNTINKDKKEKNDKKEKKGIFIIPPLEDILAYCQERQSNIDAEKFHAYYESNGWMVGKNRMRDWKAAVRTWEKSGYNNSTKDHPLRGKLSDKGIQTYENLKKWGQRNEEQDTVSTADAGIVRDI